eukprot:COSAG01_NODE_23965_length_795_cov_1.439655_1_plen_99_part_10
MSSTSSAWRLPVSAPSAEVEEAQQQQQANNPRRNKERRTIACTGFRGQSRLCRAGGPDHTEVASCAPWATGPGLTSWHLRLVSSLVVRRGARAASHTGA